MAQTRSCEVPAYHGTEPFCFVSYSHADAATVFEQIEWLAERGYRVYYDQGIRPGHDWHDDLARAITECGLFVLFVTPRSAASGHCVRELNFALAQKRPVLAVHMEAVELPPGLELALGDRQAILKPRLDEHDYKVRLEAAVAEHLGDPAVTRSPAPPAAERRQTWGVGAWVAVVGLIVAVGGLGLWNWQGEETAPQGIGQNLIYAEIEDLIAADRYAEAYLLARELSREPDSKRSDYFEKIVIPSRPRIPQDGVSVAFRPYDRPDIEHIEIGQTPFAEPLLLPRGVLQLRLSSPGHETLEIGVQNPGPLFANTRYYERLQRRFPNLETIQLQPLGSGPADMVGVPMSSSPVLVGGWTRTVLGSDLTPSTPAFMVSRYEVTNAQYKAFVDAGSYEQADYWDDLAFDDKRPWQQAVAQFVDSTGRQGPSTWAYGNFGDGEAELPVGGISWYEAVAYARFRDLELPTIHHWARFALAPFEGLFPLSPSIERVSNVGGRGPVGAREPIGLGPWGTFHTAGNVREWVWNRAGVQGLVQGSSWQDYGISASITQVHRMDRNAANGVRLIAGDVPPALRAPIDVIYDDPVVERKPVSDEGYALLLSQFAPARSPLEQTVVTRAGEGELWTADEHQLRFESGDEFTLYVFLPRSGQGPWQTVLFGPAANAITQRRPNAEALELVRDFLYVLRAGRAVVVPIWNGTYSRALGYPDASDLARWTASQRQLVLGWHRDVVESLDYAATLTALDTRRVTFLGFSWGACCIGPVVMALEPRVTEGVFISGGAMHFRPLNPLFDALNYYPHITQPVLQMNGRYDHLFPLDSAAVPAFELLGTPEADKKLVIFDTGHIGFPENQMVREVIDWLDRYRPADPT